MLTGHEADDQSRLEQPTPHAHSERRGLESLDAPFYFDTRNRHAHRIVNPHRLADQSHRSRLRSSSDSNCTAGCACSCSSDVITVQQVTITNDELLSVGADIADTEIACSCTSGIDYQRIDELASMFATRREGACIQDAHTRPARCYCY